VTTPQSLLEPAKPPPLQVLWRWLLLAVSSAFLAFALTAIGMPAAFLLGPMLCGIVAGALGSRLEVPAFPWLAAQAMLGVLVAASLSPSLLGSFLSHWMLFLGVVIATLCASSLVGYMISRWRIMPGTTGVWGSAPGAATAMVIMAEAFGADARLVAFMQYLRVVTVTAVAALVARMFVDVSDAPLEPTIWFPAIEPFPFAATLGVAAVGGFLGWLLKMPSPVFMGALILGIALEFPGLVTFQMPEWLLALSYAVIGWTIGLKFDRDILRHVLRVLPQVVGSILFLIAFCGGLAWLLVVLTGIDPLTAYLATSPGGMDSVAIIAAASQDVNLSFVMSVQMLRFLIVLLLGPAIARGVARLLSRRQDG
jgi:membrane AbrB-like protein